MQSRIHVCKRKGGLFCENILTAAMTDVDK